jgi:hypothetical protein
MGLPFHRARIATISVQKREPQEADKTDDGTE